jgi:hypothetical protein
VVGCVVLRDPLVPEKTAPVRAHKATSSSLELLVADGRMNPARVRFCGDASSDYLVPVAVRSSKETTLGLGVAVRLR